MRRALVAVLGAAFALAVGSATATAAPGQLAGESSASGQDAGALAGSWQGAPSNTAFGARVLSPGDDGDVSQSNDATAKAGAVNLNGTGQEVDQSQGGSGTQVAGQKNSSDQSADAGALAVQEKPSNTADGTRVLSPGDDGDVSQSNDADAGALAANGNLTGQDIDQSQGGAPAAAPASTSTSTSAPAPCGCESDGGTQVAGQANDSDQSAHAGAAAVQEKPSNTAVGIRVLSPGDGGDVEQSNSADAGALAANGNLTHQDIDQTQDGESCRCEKHDGGGTQVAGQSNDSDQSAAAGAIAAQKHPSNTAVGIRVLSPGDDGDVSQSNSADAGALAANGNLTGQEIDQSQGGSGTQVAGQANDSDQSAHAGAAAVQEKPSNTAVGIRVLSPGDGGDVEQSNSADAGALAANGNLTHQDIDQTQDGESCRCEKHDGGGTQVAGQSNDSDQSAAAGAIAAQKHPSNTAVGIRVLSPGDDGDVSQSNDASAKAGAVNLNATGQEIDQSQGGSGTQVAGQANDSDQSAHAGAAAVQEKPSNTAVGIRVLSPDGGDVEQSNSADAGALAANGNFTKQDIDQTQDGKSCGCGDGGTQVAGQKNGNWQAAGAVAVAAQDKPSNTAVGIRVLSPGDDGDVSQSNDADAGALAANGNFTHQDIDQTQDGGKYPCGCGAGGTQVAGQANESGQHAFALGLAAQLHPSNTASATKVGDGRGCGCDWRLKKVTTSGSGDVEQSNDVSAKAGALNLNATGQDIDQKGGGTQVAGQLNKSWQGAAALAAALQFGAANRA